MISVARVPRFADALVSLHLLVKGMEVLKVLPVMPSLRPFVPLDASIREVEDLWRLAHDVVVMVMDVASMHASRASLPVDRAPWSVDRAFRRTQNAHRL